jgi:tetratricopeptide (TPR) repeat protein
MSFKLVDLATGSTLVSHAKKYDYDSDRDGKKSTMSKLIGGSSDVPATDVITDALVEQGARDFVAKISPHTVRVETKLASGKSPAVKSGNALAMAGDHDGALEQYKFALDQNADDHGAAFNAGLMYETMGQFDDARRLYARAASLNKDGRYAAGLARVRK